VLFSFPVQSSPANFSQMTQQRPQPY